MAVVVNKLIPEFESNATGQVKVTNLSHLGQTVVLYFYPKDNTPGCTTEAMQFRDKYKDFAKAGAAVFGVSRDNMKSHDEFKTKLELPFELIADTEEKMCHMFGVVKNKIMYGKKVKGIERSTFLIGPDGILKQEWRGLKVPGHVEDVLKAVKALKKASSVAAKEAATAKEATPKEAPKKESAAKEAVVTAA
jgi:peroxiredoxin Q/BCP